MHHFNPHTREGCDHTYTHCHVRLLQISIHTPVKGVTRAAQRSHRGMGISIHTPVKGVTASAATTVAASGYFNPHTREGCDNTRSARPVAPLPISIHTPVKGVTSGCPGAVSGDCISIHTPVKGVTCSPPLGLHEVPISIHTPVKGVT